MPTFTLGSDLRYLNGLSEEWIKLHINRGEEEVIMMLQLRVELGLFAEEKFYIHAFIFIICVQ